MVLKEYCFEKDNFENNSAAVNNTKKHAKLPARDFATFLKSWPEAGKTELDRHYKWIKYHIRS